MSTNKHINGCWLHMDIYILISYMLVNLCNSMHGGPISVILDQTSPKSFAKKLPTTLTQTSTSDISQIIKNNMLAKRYDTAFRDPNTNPTTAARSQPRHSWNSLNPNQMPTGVRGQTQSGPDTIPSGKVQLTDVLVSNSFGTVKNSLKPQGSSHIDPGRMTNARIGLKAPVNTAVYPDWYNAIFNALPSAQPLIQNIQNNYVDRLNIVQDNKSKQTTGRIMVRGGKGLQTNSFPIHKPSISASSTPTENRNSPPEIPRDNIILQSQGNSFSNLISSSPNQQVDQELLPPEDSKGADIQMLNSKQSTPRTQQFQQVSARGDTVTFNVETSADQTLLNSQQYDILSSSKLPFNEGFPKEHEQIVTLPRDGVNANAAAIQHVFNHGTDTAKRLPASKSVITHFHKPTMVAEQIQTASSRGMVPIEKPTNILQQQSTNPNSHTARLLPFHQTIRRLNPAGKQFTFNVETSPGSEAFPVNINSNVFESSATTHMQSQVASDPRTGQSSSGSTTSQEQHITAPFIRYDPSGKPVTFNVETSSVTSSFPSDPNQASSMSGHGKRKSAGTDTLMRNRNTNVFESPLSRNMQSSATGQSDIGTTRTLVDSSSRNQKEHHIVSIQRYSPSGKAVTFNVETNVAQASSLPETQRRDTMSAISTHRSSTNNKHSVDPLPQDRPTFESMPSTMQMQQSQGFIRQPATGINTQKTEKRPNQPKQNGLPIYHENIIDNAIKQAGKENDHAKFARILTEVALQNLKAEIPHRQNLGIPSEHFISRNMKNKVHHSVIPKQPVKYHNHMQASYSGDKSSKPSSHIDGSTSEKLDTLHTILHLIIDELRNPDMTYTSKRKMVHTDKEAKDGNVEHMLKTDTLDQPPSTEISRSKTISSLDLNTMSGKHAMSKLSNLESTPGIESQRGQQINSIQSQNQHTLDSTWLHPITITNIQSRRPKHRQQQPLQQNQQLLQHNQQLLQQNPKHPQQQKEHRSPPTQPSNQQLLLKQDQHNQQIQQQQNPKQQQIPQQQNKQRPSTQPRHKHVILKQHQQTQQQLSSIQPDNQKLLPKRDQQIRQQQPIQLQNTQPKSTTKPDNQQLTMQQNHQQNQLSQQQQKHQLTTQTLTQETLQQTHQLNTTSHQQQRSPSTQQLTLKSQQQNELTKQQQAEQNTQATQPFSQHSLLQQIQQQQQLIQRQNQQQSLIKPHKQHIQLDEYQKNNKTQQNQQTSNQHVQSAKQHNQNILTQQNLQQDQLFQQQQQTQKQQDIQQPLKQHKQQLFTHSHHQLPQQRQLNQQDHVLFHQKPKQEKQQKANQHPFKQNEIHNQQLAHNLHQAQQHKGKHKQMIQFNHRREVNKPQQQKQQQKQQQHQFNGNRQHKQPRQVLSSQSMLTQLTGRTPGSGNPHNKSPSTTELTFHIPSSDHGNVVLEVQGDIGNIGNISYGKL